MEQQVTIRQLAESNGRIPDTLYRKAKKVFPEKPWSVHSSVTETEARIILGDVPASVKNPGKLRKTIPPAHIANIGEKPAEMKIEIPPAPVSHPTNFRRIAADSLLISAVIGHAGLIWYDCVTLWGEPGLIGGGLVTIVVLSAVLFAADPNLPRTSGAALWFVFLVDCAAFWVHFPTFQTPIMPDSITAALCIFICACSFMALYLFRDSKIF